MASTCLQGPGDIPQNWALETFLTAVYCHMDHLAGSSANADIAGRARKAKKSMEDGTFVAFCHFLADVFAGITKFSLLLQKNETILPQAVCALENLLVTTEVMAARPKPGCRLSQFMADLRLQRQQDEQSEMPLYKFQTVTLKGEVYKLAEDGGAITKLQREMEATIKSTVKHLKARFCSLLGEDATESATTKAVKCCNIFNHDSWPEDQEDSVDCGAEDLAFLLDHSSPVLTS
ncbi:hypothetical protein PBY51_022995 [Eleginops maclovinus]|uniref:Uncharacterized protein n=1 Tax=Eleginops maclovinus TaxID=56733 RepID=A0AAN8ANK8_ELEMC|nr:hypothetical protein PBY51_022995 [Eleginops maclovinus]